jgi:hypothetical protein
MGSDRPENSDVVVVGAKSRANASPIRRCDDERLGYLAEATTHFAVTNTTSRE